MQALGTNQNPVRAASDSATSRGVSQAISGMRDLGRDGVGMA